MKDLTLSSIVDQLEEGPLYTETESEKVFTLFSMVYYQEEGPLTLHRNRKGFYPIFYGWNVPTFYRPLNRTCRVDARTLSGRKQHNMNVHPGKNINTLK